MKILYCSLCYFHVESVQRNSTEFRVMLCDNCSLVYHVLVTSI